MKENTFSFIKKSFEGDSKMVLSKEKLAKMLSKISVINEYFPDSPWLNETKVWKKFNYSFQGKDVSDLQTTFHKVILTIVDEYDCIAIAFSGGLDSLAILLEVYMQCKNKGKKCIAITAEMFDDKKESCGLHSQKILQTFNIDCKHIIFTPKTTSSLYWSETGIRAEAMPNAVQEMANLAKIHNAEVILSGVGADSILACPKYLTHIFLSKRRYKHMFRYLSDIAISGFWGIRREFSSLFANRLSPYSNAKAYMALSDADLCDVEVNQHLNEPYRTNINTWSKKWLISNIELLMKHHYSWAKMEVISMLEMYDPLSPSGSIQHINPYENAEIVKVSTEIPLEFRYNPLLQSPYLRHKALVVSLIDEKYKKKLPQYKKTFKDTIMKHSADTYSYPKTLLATGMLCNNFIEKFNIDDVYGNNMLARITMLDMWLEEALKRGYDLK